MSKPNSSDLSLDTKKWNNPFSSRNMFMTSAWCFSLSIIGHTKYGFDYYYEGLDLSFPQHWRKEEFLYAFPHLAALNIWNYVNTTFALASCLSLQWRQTQGLRTSLDYIMFLALTMVGLWGGSRFYMIGAYQPCIPLVFGNLVMITGAVLGNRERKLKGQ